MQARPHVNKEIQIIACLRNGDLRVEIVFMAAQKAAHRDTLFGLVIQGFDNLSSIHLICPLGDLSSESDLWFLDSP